MSNDSISDEDKALFRAQMRGVQPLADKRQGVKLPKPEPVYKAPAKASKPVPQRPDYPLSDYIKETVLSETPLSYCSSALSRRRFRDLQRGEIPWQAKLDLHGFTIESAREALMDFLARQFDRQLRCLLIIHGKGGHQGKPPVIKNQINRWLPQFDEVLAFHSALPKDGGLGAVYVFLKKHPLADAHDLG